MASLWQQGLVATSCLLVSAPLVAVESQAQSVDVLYNGCNVEDYYADLLIPGTTTSNNLRDDVTRQEMETLLESTHRNVLPYTNRQRDDVWKALIDLDGGEDADGNNHDDSIVVRLIYRQEDVPARPYGTAPTWNREHLWPKSRGVGYDGADFTDVHHLRPADWNVNAARSNLFFGDCGIAQAMSKCISPAHEEAANDTALDSTIFLPPASVRGDIARAMLYMDIRYSAQNNNGIDLIVTDCPTADQNEMAYKSALLQWHILDPPSDSERQRNQRACERWQGNRNPFVDYPELTQHFFGIPQTLLGDGLGYPCNTITTTNPVPTSTIPGPTPPSPPPTATSRNPCQEMLAGDVMFIAMNSDNPDLVVFVALKDLQEGLVLYLTDNSWTGSSFRTNEGTISLWVPSPGIAAGTVFGYGGHSTTNLLHHADWESVQGAFQLSASGDTLLLYCQNDQQEAIQFLSGLDYTGMGWMEPNLPPNDYTSSRSSLPDQLRLANNGAISLPHLDNYRYIGSTDGSITQLQKLLSDPNQWEGSNEVGMLPPLPTSFALPPSSTQQWPSPGDVMVVAMNSVDPDMVALVALENLPGRVELYMTDNAWTGNAFRTNEGTIKLTIPSTGIEAGTIFGYGGPNLFHGTDWEAVGGNFALSQSSDAIFVYTKNKSDQVQHISAFSYSGGWMETGLAEDAYGRAGSSLPVSLRSIGALSLPHKDSYAYVGSTEGGKAVLQMALQNEANWRGSNTDPVAVPTTRFAVSSSTSGGPRHLALRSSSLFLQVLASSLVRALAV